MSHLLYLMFRCDGDVMESLDFEVVFEGSKHTQRLDVVIVKTQEVGKEVAHQSEFPTNGMKKNSRSQTMFCWTQ